MKPALKVLSMREHSGSQRWHVWKARPNIPCSMKMLQILFVHS